MDEKRAFVGALELASELGLPVAWVRHEARAGRLPALRVGRRTMFDVEAVKRVLTERAARRGEGVADEG
jgi:hypothetical protein